MLSLISMEMKTDSRSTMPLFDRANSQFLQHSHRHLLCIFTSNEQEPASGSDLLSP